MKCPPVQIAIAIFCFFPTSTFFATDLTAVRSGTNVTLIWPTAATNDFYLQSCANLNPPITWINSPDPFTNGQNVAVTNDNSGTARFFRLKAWEVLFDGSSVSAFRGYTQANFPATNLWMITTDGELATVPTNRLAAPDIVTRATFGDFELRWEWKATSNANSGVYYRGNETTAEREPTDTAPEYQLLDDFGTTSGDALSTNGNRHIAAVYGVLSAVTNKIVKAAGEWNQCRLIVETNHVQHWLNGQVALDYQINSPQWTNAVTGANHPISSFGQATNAPIVFQHHGEQVWFRNIKVRRLPP